MSRLVLCTHSEEQRVAREKREAERARNARNQQERRKRMRESGFTLRQFWVHEEDAERVKVWLQQLRNARIVAMQHEAAAGCAQREARNEDDNL